MWQKVVIHTVLEGIRRAFWRNGKPAATAVEAIKDLLHVKHISNRPFVDDAIARIVAHVVRILTFAICFKVAQYLGIDVNLLLDFVQSVPLTPTDFAVPLAPGDSL